MLPLTLKAHSKTRLKMSSALVVCCKYLIILTNVIIETNNVDSDQTAPIGAV